jgi:hypothetical protein
MHGVDLRHARNYPRAETSMLVKKQRSQPGLKYVLRLGREEHALIES